MSEVKAEPTKELQSCRLMGSRLQRPRRGSKQAASPATCTLTGHLVPMNALPVSGGPAQALMDPALHAFSEDLPSKAAPVPLCFMYNCVFCDQ